MPHILIVCTANICRSPVAEALLRDRLEMQEYERFTVSSAGTWAEPGQCASAFGAQIMAEQDLDISSHRSQVIDERLMEKADLILCMATGHAEALRAEFPKHIGKVFMLTEMVDMNYSISDPYGGPRDNYERMVDELTDLIEDGLAQIAHQAETNAIKRD